jgi:hypothetical protein
MSLRYRILIFFTILSFLNCGYCSVQSTCRECKDALEEKYSSPLLQKAIEWEKNFRLQTIQSTQALSSVVGACAETMDKDKWQEDAVNQVEADLNHIRRIKTALKVTEVWEHSSWPLRTTKMEEALEGASQLLQKDFSLLIEENQPEGYAMDWGKTTILGNQETIWGNPKGTFLKTALLILARTAHPQKDFADILGTGGIDESPITHVISVPKALDLSNSEYKVFTFSYQDSKIPNGLIYTHSGYSFGGHRDEPRYPKGKKWGPEDCSSFIAKLTGITNKAGASLLFNTSDQASLFHYKLGGFLPKDWAQQESSVSMLDWYEPIKVRDAQRDIKPGYIYAHRTYKDETFKTSSLGTGGHTTLITHLQSDGLLQTIGYARDIPNKIEGFGLSGFNLNSDMLKEVMIFSVKHPSILS